MAGVKGATGLEAAEREVVATRVAGAAVGAATATTPWAAATGVAMEATAAMGAAAAALRAATVASKAAILRSSRTHPRSTVSHHPTKPLPLGQSCRSICPHLLSYSPRSTSLEIRRRKNALRAGPMAHPLFCTSGLTRRPTASWGSPRSRRLPKACTSRRSPAPRHWPAAAPPPRRACRRSCNAFPRSLRAEISHDDRYVLL